MSSKGDPPATTPRPSASVATSAQPPKQEDADAGAVATRTPIPEGPPKWKTIPKADNGFHVVLDGLCSQLTATRVGKDVVINYGGKGNSIYLGPERRGAASFIALRESGLESIGDPRITSPTGVTGRSLDDFWVADSTGSRSSEGAVLHRYVGGQWKQYPKDQTNIHAWLDGGVIGTLSMMAHNGEVWVEGSSTKPPAALAQDLWAPSLAAFPTGEVLVVGHTGGDNGPNNGPQVARAWAPGKKLESFAMSKYLPASEDWVHFALEVAPNEVYAQQKARLLRWDGTGFYKLAVPKGEPEIERLFRVAPDDLWARTATNALFRITKDAATPIATPEPIVDVDGFDKGTPYAVGASGKLYKREGESWTQVPIASPVFSGSGVPAKAKRVLVAAPDDVLVIAMYWEKAPGWTEQELHTMLLRTKPVKETLRCNEPDPENNNLELGRGFQSWPPVMNQATAECKTSLFVVMARRSNAIKKTDDWPRLTKALKGQVDELVEFTSGDRTFVGAKAKDLESAKKMVASVSKVDRLRPEIVCGDPDPKRTVAVAQ
jgi:hypothetical protein